MKLNKEFRTGLFILPLLTGEVLAQEIVSGKDFFKQKQRKKKNFKEKTYQKNPQRLVQTTDIYKSIQVEAEKQFLRGINFLKKIQLL